LVFSSYHRFSLMDYKGTMFFDVNSFFFIFFGFLVICVKKFMYAFGICCIRWLCLTLKPLAVRVPAELEKEIIEIVKQEKLDKATVVRNLLEVGINEWRKQTALDFLQKGKVTFAKAAEIANLSLWEFSDLIKQRNIEWVRFAPEDVEKEFGEASAAKRK